MLRGSTAGWLAAALLLLGSGPPAHASVPQPARSVTARVLDSKSREPLADVAVSSGAAAVVTDAAGRFTLSILADSSRVTLQRIGYRPAVFRASELPLEIALVRAPVVLTSLHVTASAAPMCCLGKCSHLCLCSTSRETVSERGCATTAEALETTEGVSTSRPGSWGAKAYLRGLGGERVAVLLDGDRVNRACNIGMDAGLATLDPDNIERVEVLSGPGSTLYGSGNVGGVINVVTRGPRAGAPLEGEFRTSASSAVPGGRVGGTLWGHDDRFAFSAAADGASYGNERSPRGEIGGSSFRDLTVDLKGSYGIDMPNRLDARVQRYFGRDIGYPGSGNARIPEEDRLLLSLDYGGQVSRGILDAVNAKLYLQSVDHHMTISMTKPPAVPGGVPMRSDTDARSNTDTWGARAQARLHPAGPVNLDAGFEGTQWNADGTRWVEKRTASGTTTTEFRTWPGVRVADLGSFAQGSVGILSWLEGSAGIRLDDVVRRADGHATTTEWVQSGNLGLRVSRGDGPFARASLGFGYRIPDPTELYGILLRPDGFVYIGDADLRTETSRSVELSAGWTGSRFSGSATVYRNRIADFISTVVTGDSISGAPVRQYRNVADARIDGVSGSFSWEARPSLHLRGTLAYSRGEDRSTGAPLPMIAPLEGTAAARLTPGRAWPWIEPELLFAARQTRAALRQGEVNTPGFAAVNLRAGRALGRTTVVAGVENALDQPYRRHLDPVRVLRPGRNLFVKMTRSI